MSRPARSLIPAFFVALLAAAIGGGPAAPVPTAAQEPYSPLVPPGMARLGIGGSYLSFSSVYGWPTGGTGAGTGEVELSSLFSGTVGTRVFPSLLGFEEAVRRASDDAYEASLGRLASAVEKNSVRVPLALDVGVLEWLTVGVSVPFVRNEAEFASLFAADSASANAGFSPAAGDPALVSGFMSSFGASVQQYEVYKIGVCASDPGSGGCRDATALLESSQAFRLALAEMYASPLAPLAQSAAGVALQARLAAFAQAFSSAGVAGTPSAMPLADAAFTMEDLQTFVTDPDFGIAASHPLSKWKSLWMIGDIELRMNARWLEHEGPDGTFRITAGAGTVVRLPTGKQDDPANFLDQGSGDAQLDIEVRGWTRARWNSRIGLWADLRYGLQLQGTTERRVYIPGFTMPPARAQTDLEWNPGDYVFAEVAPWYQLVEDISIVAGYRYFWKGKDSFALRQSSAEPSPELALQRNPPDPDVLVEGSGVTTGEMVMGFVYRRSSAGQDGDGGSSGRPLEARAVYRQVVAGSGRDVPRSGSLEASFRLYVNVWGR